MNSPKKRNILIVRPPEYGASLFSKLLAADFNPIRFPTIEFGPTPNQQILQAAIQKLNTTDIIIFTSRAAVLFGIEAIQNFGILPADIKCVAIGPATKEALLQRGIQNVICPEDPPYESEALLKLPIFQNIKDTSIKIFRGNGGRQLLFETLVARGAELEFVECYQRCVPSVNSYEIMKFFKENDSDDNLDAIIIVMSIESLMNFKKMVPVELWSSIQRKPLIVISERLKQKAQDLGFSKVLLSKSTEDDSIISLLR